MFATTARRSTAFLLFGALQFVVLTTIAMRLYPGYHFSDHFFSDLGATHTWYGVPNHAVPVFVVAVVTLGASLVVFAGAWRDYAFERGRTRGLGVASQLCGTFCGLAFAAVGMAPIDRALDLHNALVVTAFGLLLVFAACTTALWWRNGGPRGVVVSGVLYVLLLVGYFASAAWAATDLFAHRRVLIVGQKIVVYASMAYVVFLTLAIRRRRG